LNSASLDSRLVGGSKISVAGFQPSTEVSWAICDFSDTESENQMELFAHDSAPMLHKLDANGFALQFLNQLNQANQF